MDISLNQMMVKKIKDYIVIVSSCRVDNIKLSFEDIISSVLDETREWQEARIREENCCLLKVISFFNVEFLPSDEIIVDLREYLETEYFRYCMSKLEEIYVDTAVKLNEMGA